VLDLRRPAGRHEVAPVPADLLGAIVRLAAREAADEERRQVHRRQFRIKIAAGEGMKIFIAGATGVLGRRVIPLLRKGGHEVIGASRRPENRALLEELGASARDVDLFDPDGVARATEGADAILHLATAIPGGRRTTARDWAPNDRLRTDGTRALVAAAAKHRVRLYLQQSVLFVLGDHGDDWVDEDTPLPARQVPIIRSSVEMERIVREADVPALTLRLGGFYGSESGQTRMLIDMIRARKMKVLGNGTNFWSQIHIADAASAVAAGVRAGATGVLHVCDDEPVRQRDLLAHLAGLHGVKPPGRVPAFAARLAAGSAVNAILLSIRARNARARQALGWAPRHATFREGYAEVLADVRK
jgi:nucleoside-diphosphate-sugar epimerase